MVDSGTNQVKMELIWLDRGSARVLSSLKQLTAARVKLTAADVKASVAEEKLAKATEKLRNQEDKAKNAAKAHIAVLTDQQKKFMVLESQIKKYGAAMKNSGSIFKKSTKVHSQFKATVKNLGTQYDRMGGNSKKLLSHNSDLLSSFTRFRWLLVNVTLVAYGLKKAFDVVFKSAIELESQMANVQKTTNFSAAEIKKLRVELVEMSKTLPVTSKELGEIATVAGQLGLGKYGVGAVKAFTKTIAMMGIATELTAEDAAKSLAKISQAFKVPISDINALGSVINELSNTTAATSTEIANSLLRVGAAASNLGLSVQFVAALQSTLIDAGVRAERAGTRMISALNKITANAAKFADFIGMTFKDFAQVLNDEPEKAFLMIIKKLRDMDSPLNRAAKTTELFGKVAGQNITTIVGNYDDLIENVEVANNEMEVGLSLLRETAVQVGTTANQWDILGNRMKAVVSNTEGPINKMLTGINNRMEAQTLQAEKYGTSLSGWEATLVGVTTAAGAIIAGVVAAPTVVGTVPAAAGGGAVGAGAGLAAVSGIEKLFGESFKDLAPEKIDDIKKSLQSLYSPDQYAMVQKIIDGQDTLNQKYYVATNAISILKNRYTVLNSEQLTNLDGLSKENKILGKNSEAWIYLKNTVEKVKEEYMHTGIMTEQMMQTLKQSGWVIEQAMNAETVATADYLDTLETAKTKLLEVRAAQQAAFDARNFQEYIIQSQEVADVTEDINNQFTNGVAIIDGFETKIKDLTSAIDNFKKAYAKVTMTEYAYEMSELKDQYKEYLILAMESDDVTRAQADTWYINSRTIAAYKHQISTLKDELDGLNAILKGTQDELKKVNDEIKTLSNAKFTGELGFQQKMSEYERYLKQIDFEEMTGMSAFEFINATMDMSNAQLREFLKTFEEVNDETKSGKDSYSAWQDTVKEFITSTVMAGNDLGQSVSDAVNQYSTLLLSTSRFEDSADNQSNAVGLLGDAYDIHYGGMHDEVQDQIDLQNQEGNTVYANAQQIIAALQIQWAEQERLTTSIEDQQASVDSLAESLENVQDEYEGMLDGMNSFAESITDAMNRIHGLIDAMEELNSIPTIQGTGNNPFENTSPAFDDWINNGGNNGGNNNYNPPEHNNQWYIDHGVDRYGNPIDYAMASGGIVTQPTQALIGEAGPEAVIPLDKMGSMGTNVTISNINISGVNSSDPSDFAYKFARELKRELRTI